ncbi:hypothetical protein [Arthrobacter sp. RT-1]|uniref:hypothetical protein n=1 Tax=Arthrobacter sp. RT-1 TaxID=2292263 RepID=UPI0011C02F14|nr:hypothetical protein [Arthrobacter sp. RT-1]
MTALILWIFAGLFLYVWPRADTPEPVDALFVLAPQGARTALAEQLMEQGIADTLAISAPGGDDAAIDQLCKQKRAYRIICFDPDPVTTQGEARAIQALSNEYGWENVSVLTAQFHVTRSRILIQRCYKGSLAMIPFARAMPIIEFPHVGQSSWAYHFVYESAAFVKVALRREC